MLLRGLPTDDERRATWAVLLATIAGAFLATVRGGGISAALLSLPFAVATFALVHRARWLAARAPFDRLPLVLGASGTWLFWVGAILGAVRPRPPGVAIACASAAVVELVAARLLVVARRRWLASVARGDDRGFELVVPEGADGREDPACPPLDGPRELEGRELRQRGHAPAYRAGAPLRIGHVRPRRTRVALVLFPACLLAWLPVAASTSADDKEAILEACSRARHYDHDEWDDLVVPALRGDRERQRNALMHACPSWAPTERLRIAGDVAYVLPGRQRSDAEEAASAEAGGWDMHDPTPVQVWVEIDGEWLVKEP